MRNNSSIFNKTISPYDYMDAGGRAKHGALAEGAQRYTEF